MKRKLYVAIVNDFTTYQEHKLLIQILLYALSPLVLAGASWRKFLIGIFLSFLLSLLVSAR